MATFFDEGCNKNAKGLEGIGGKVHIGNLLPNTPAIEITSYYECSCPQGKPPAIRAQLSVFKRAIPL
jgi:hypothetical protein